MTLTPEVQQALDSVRGNRRLARLVAEIGTILELIPTNDAVPAIRREGSDGLMERTGIGRARIAFCIQWVRHHLPEIGDSLISGPEGYRRTLDQRRVRDYRLHWIGHARTMLRTILRVIDPVLRGMERSGLPSDRLLATQIRLGMERVVQDMDALVKA